MPLDRVPGQPFGALVGRADRRGRVVCPRGFAGVGQYGGAAVSTPVRLRLIGGTIGALEVIPRAGNPTAEVRQRCETTISRGRKRRFV